MRENGNASSFWGKMRGVGEWGAELNIKRKFKYR